MRVKDSGYADLEAQLNVNRDLERQKSELDKKLAEATELNSRSLEMHASEIEKLEESLRKAKKDNDDLLQKCTALRCTLESNAVELKAKFDANMRDKVAGFNETLAQIRQSYEREKVHFSRYQTDIENLQVMQENLQKIINMKDQLIDERVMKISELTETISHVNHQLHQREAAMDALAEENKAINKATDKMEMTTDELRKTIRELLLEKDESFKKLMSLEKKIMKCRCDNI